MKIKRQTSVFWTLLYALVSNNRMRSLFFTQLTQHIAEGCNIGTVLDYVFHPVSICQPSRSCIRCNTMLECMYSGKTHTYCEFQNQPRGPVHECTLCQMSSCEQCYLQNRVLENYNCIHCNCSCQISFLFRQTRATDEAMTTYCLCKKCKCTWQMIL